MRAFSRSAKGGARDRAPIWVGPHIGVERSLAVTSMPRARVRQPHWGGATQAVIAVRHPARLCCTARVRNGDGSERLGNDAKEGRERVRGVPRAGIGVRRRVAAGGGARLRRSLAGRNGDRDLSRPAAIAQRGPDNTAHRRVCPTDILRSIPQPSALACAVERGTLPLQLGARVYGGELPGAGALPGSAAAVP